MRSMIVALLMLLVGGCNKPAQRDGPVNDAIAVSESSAAGPKVNAATTPGVAFAYRYDFRIAGEKLQKLQESHAQACEALGPMRCRITGLSYEQGRDPADSYGAIDFRLDPALARRFGAQGIDVLMKAGGTLGGMRVTGEDVGGTLDEADVRISQARDELARIEAELAKLPPRAEERATLRERAAELRDAINQGTNESRVQRQSLAVTPVHFDYHPGGTGWLDGESTLGMAWGIASQSFAIATMLLLTVAAGGLPWLALAALGYASWRAIRMRLAARAQ